MKRFLIRLRRACSAYKNIMFHGEGASLFVSWIALACILIALLNIGYSMSPLSPKHVDTSEIVSQVEGNNVAYMHISTTDTSVEGTFNEPVNGITRFQGLMPHGSDETIKLLMHSGTAYDLTKPNAVITELIVILRTVLPMVIAIGIVLVVMSQETSLDISNRKHDKDFAMTTEHTTFADVCGEPEAVEEVRELVTFVRDRRAYDNVGAKIPHGILLQGDPGNGKTLLARALAGEAGVPFFATSGSDFVEMYVGVGAKRVRELFEAAREAQPSIIFIDEIDAIGSNRDASSMSYTDEHLQTLNQLLTEMDGFDENDNVMVIAATNRGSKLDPALLRPGRFDRIITVDNPARTGRAEILQHYAIGHPFAEPLDFETLAKHTYGFSGAQLESVMNQAATLAARRSIDFAKTALITNDDIEEGIARVIGGPAAKSRMMSDDERRLVAYHEAGHAVIQYVLPDCNNVQKISIVSRNMADVGATMGYVQTYSEEDHYVMTVEQMRDEISALLGGRCAEEMFCHTETAGASDDLLKASKLAYAMASQYACVNNDFNENVKHLRMSIGTLGHDSSGPLRLNRIDDEADKLLQQRYAVTYNLLKNHSNDIQTIVDVLLENEQIDADMIEDIMEGRYAKDKATENK